MDTARRVPTDESYHYFVAEIQNVSRETFFVREYPPVENVPQEHFQGCNTAGGKQGGAVLFAPPSKSCRLSHPPSPCAQ